MTEEKAQAAFSPLRSFEAIVSGARRAWLAGGTWERFFILLPMIWAVYVASGFVWLFVSSQSFIAGIAFSLVAISFIALLDAWLTPVLSSGVLTALVGTGQFRSDENARMLADYLNSLGRGGRWILGNAVSFVYFLIFVLWGIAAIPLSLTIGGSIFLVANVALIMMLYLSYRRLLLRVERDAVSKGYPLRRIQSTHSGRFS